MVQAREEEAAEKEPENYFEALERVNSELVRLVQLLIDHIKGDKKEYEYRYGQGWTVDEHNSMKEQLEKEEPQEQLKAVKELLKKYELKED